MRKDHDEIYSDRFKELQKVTNKEFIYMLPFMDKKRLFIGFSIDAPWPTTYPRGRIIEEKNRHITLAFLGMQDAAVIKENLKNFPKSSFDIGPCGICDQILFLPKIEPRVVAYHITWLTKEAELTQLLQQIHTWLAMHNLPSDSRPFLSHATVARAPFLEKDWEETFSPMPLIISGVHLYESIGNLHYQSLWNLPFLTPFEEYEHTADIAFFIRGNTLTALYVHACIALSFKYPPIFSFFQHKEIENLRALVQAINTLISLCDQEIGCPFKAVSYHGKMKQNQFLEWEMIVDV